ncbi:hypothetical protein AB205_0215250, partial [Aquarana catesbeiana]
APFWSLPCPGPFGTVLTLLSFTPLGLHRGTSVDKAGPASNMSFGEMLEMVDILKKADYDGKYGPYPNPNIRKAKIMAKVVKSLHRKFRGFCEACTKQGRKDSEDTPHPRRPQIPHLGKKGKYPQPKKSRRRKK